MELTTQRKANGSAGDICLGFAMEIKNFIEASLAEKDAALREAIAEKDAALREAIAEKDAALREAIAEKELYYDKLNNLRSALASAFARACRKPGTCPATWLEMDRNVCDCRCQYISARDWGYILDDMYMDRPFGSSKEKGLDEERCDDKP